MTNKQKIPEIIEIDMRGQVCPACLLVAMDTMNKHRDPLNKGREEGVDIVLFPELSIPGYPPEDLLLIAPFISAVEEQLEKIIPCVQGLTAIIGTVRGDPDHRPGHSVLRSLLQVNRYRGGRLF